MNNPPFIPGWFDDAGLSQAEFRVYCHLCRRADNKSGIAWPKCESIMEACHMSRKTVWKALRTLEEKGFIHRVGKPFAGSNRYQVLVPSIGGNEAPNATVANRSKSEPPIGANEIRQSEQMRHREGSPMKVPQRRVSSQRGFNGCANKSKLHTPIDTVRRAATIEEA